MNHSSDSESFLSVRRGKIARLPADIRLQLNQRLDDGLDAGQILPWLNNLPEVREIIQTRFDSVPISPQNLSAWRQGGFQQWLIHRQLFDTAAHLHEQLEDFQVLFNVVNNDQAALKLADMMITQLTIRFTSILAQWTGGAPDPQTREILKIGQFIIKLQQAAYRAQRQAAELPAIRYRVKHEVQTDLRNEIYSDMIREKAHAIEEAKTKQKQSQKKTPPTPPPSTSNQSTPSISNPPPNVENGLAASKPPGEGAPIKPNQASHINTPSIPSTQPSPAQTAGLPRRSFSEGGSTQSTQSAP